MSNYQRLPELSGYSPPWKPHRTSADLAANELEPLDSNEQSAPSRPSNVLSHSHEGAYSYADGREAGNSFDRSAPSHRSELHDHDDDNYDSYRYSNAPDLEDDAKALVDKGPLIPESYHTYKRRWIGLAVLTLFNLAIGWGMAAPGVVSTTAIQWYSITYPQLNNLAIASSVVFLVPAPFVIWILNRFGPKMSIIVAAVLTVIGNWIIYLGAREKSFTINIAGTIIASLASPFIMAAPTRYSRLWFGDRSRTIATGLQSLAYPLGAGIGSFTGPMMVKPVGPLDYSGQALIIAIVFTAAAIPAPFIPREPPTPPSAVAALQRLSVMDGFKSLFTNPPFYLILLTFSVFAGSIDTMTATTNQGLAAYGYSQMDAGFALAILVAVGIIAALILSPIVDRWKWHQQALKCITPVIALAYTALPFIPRTHSVPAIYLIYGIIGAASISLQPCILEIQASWTHPVSPEFSSFVCWSGSRVITAAWTLIVGSALVLDEPKYGQPAGSLFLGLIFMMIVCWLCVPAALVNGNWKFKRTQASQVKGNE